MRQPQVLNKKSLAAPTPKLLFTVLARNLLINAGGRSGKVDAALGAGPRLSSGLCRVRLFSFFLSLDG